MDFEKMKVGCPWVEKTWVPGTHHVLCRALIGEFNSHCMKGNCAPYHWIHALASLDCELQFKKLDKELGHIGGPIRF